jgi:hypothetical protein
MSKLGYYLYDTDGQQQGLFVPTVDVHDHAPGEEGIALARFLAELIDAAGDTLGVRFESAEAQGGGTYFLYPEGWEEGDDIYKAVSE